MHFSDFSVAYAAGAADMRDPRLKSATVWQGRKRTVILLGVNCARVLSVDYGTYAIA
jgi:hypothetical protein